MPKHDTERLLQYLDGTLPAAERESLLLRLDETPALRAELDRLRTMRRFLQSAVEASAEDAVRPFLADRLLRRLDARTRRSPEEELFRGLWRAFRPVAVAGLLLIAGFATYNAFVAEAFAAETSPAERVLALPPESLGTAYEFGF